MLILYTLFLVVVPVALVAYLIYISVSTGSNLDEYQSQVSCQPTDIPNEYDSICEGRSTLSVQELVDSLDYLGPLDLYQFDSQGGMKATTITLYPIYPTTDE